MTTHTAPITLPARHRVDEPIWVLHFVFALIGYAASYLAWAVLLRGRLIGRRLAIAPRHTHASVIAAAVALAVVAFSAGLLL